MGKRIVIELDAVEAHLVLGAITAREQREESLADKTFFADVAEHADVRAKVLGRVATRIVDELIPEPVTITDPVRRHILEQEIDLGMV